MLNVYAFKGSETVTAPAVNLSSARQIAESLSARFPIVRIYRQSETKLGDQSESLVESILN